jgi:hypothetical protein
MAKIHAGVSELRVSHVRLSGAARTSQGPAAYLLLFYAAECGLKYAQLRRNNLRTTERLSELDHDLVALIKNLRLPAAALGQPPPIRFSRDQKESCPASCAHQAWRYGVRINEGDEARFVTWLQRICDVVRRTIYDPLGCPSIHLAGC